MHFPSSSPAAASNPAETIEMDEKNLIFCGEDTLTNDEVRIEL